eukprot:Rhum_TRINITY_DN14316_c15_g10::Rhum_TRINITY_DN14316_c15_g10_i1::g.82530::m.82530
MEDLCLNIIILKQRHAFLRPSYHLLLSSSSFDTLQVPATASAAGTAGAVLAQNVQNQVERQTHLVVQLHRLRQHAVDVLRVAGQGAGLALRLHPLLEPLRPLLVELLLARHLRGARNLRQLALHGEHARRPQVDALLLLLRPLQDVNVLLVAGRLVHVTVGPLHELADLVQVQPRVVARQLLAPDLLLPYPEAGRELVVAELGALRAGETRLLRHLLVRGAEPAARAVVVGARTDLLLARRRGVLEGAAELQNHGTDVVLAATLHRLVAHRGAHAGKIHLLVKLVEDEADHILVRERVALEHTVAAEQHDVAHLRREVLDLRHGDHLALVLPERRVLVRRVTEGAAHSKRPVDAVVRDVSAGGLDALLLLHERGLVVLRARNAFARLRPAQHHTRVAHVRHLQRVLLAHLLDDRVRARRPALLLGVQELLVQLEGNVGNRRVGDGRRQTLKSLRKPSGDVFGAQRAAVAVEHTEEAPVVLSVDAVRVLHLLPEAVHVADTDMEKACTFSFKYFRCDWLGENRSHRCGFAEEMRREVRRAVTVRFVP